MKPLLAVVLVVVAVVWARDVGSAHPGEPRTLGLALGLTLILAYVTGELLRRFRLPRLTGYLLFGLLTGPYLGNLITERMAGELRAVTGLATTLIALIAGLMINVERLGPRLSAAARMMGAVIATTGLGILAVAWLSWPLLPIAPAATGLARLAMALLLVICVVTFSPTMTTAVITDTGARGRLSELVLLVVVLADVPIVLAFTLAMQLARHAGLATTGDEAGVLARLAWETGGAIAFGSLVGASFALYLRYVGREITLMLLATCALLAQVGSSQRIEPLFAALVAGLVIGNLAVAQGDALRAAIRRGAAPILVLFFVAVGSSLRLEVLMKVGGLALALAVLRFGLLRLGVRLGTRVSGVDPRVGRLAWTGLVSQAGITLGLAAVIATEFPDWGRGVQALVVGVIVVHELVGPVLFRHGLQRAGDLDEPAAAARPLVVVSNREPYLHARGADGAIGWTGATGGVAVALDALMRERGGTWIAHGAGPADHEVVDAHDTVPVPPDAPAYGLRRLWLPAEQFAAYYGGFSNEGLWPLCHQVDVRPQFRDGDWAAYRAVNDRFAAAIDEQLASPETPVFIQDYHLALVAARLRQRRPSVRTALFWHIPWPHPDRLRICPWARDLLRGLLANDLLAFQLERDRRNFVQAVEEELGAEIEASGARIVSGGRTSGVVAVPIGVDYDRIQGVAQDPGLAAEQQRLVECFRLEAPVIGVGVDRLDYTKGIPERLAALDRLLSLRPDLRGRLTFVQIGVPSRSELVSYGAIEAEIDDAVAAVNARHCLPGRPLPVHFHKGPLELPSLVALFRLARFCVVSSLHDGMNLVAKEFVAARDDEDGVLVLSALAGAAQELREALVINPYDVAGFTRALSRALDMPREERGARMRALRRTVAGRDVFGWASDILEGLESLWTKPLHYAARGPEDAPV